MGQNRKITVLGGSGFVGTSLCQLLTDHQMPFEIIDIQPSRRFPEQYKFGDVRDLDSLRQTVSGQVVVNLAAIHRDDVRDKSEYTRTNVLGAENTARVCTEKGIRKIVFTSTVAVYGFAEVGTGEDGAIAPFNEYGRTKYEAEERFRAWQADDSENRLLIVRPTVIFGEGNRGNVFNLLNQIASGRFVMVGDGANHKSMAYVRNVAAFLLSCTRTSYRYGVFNYVDTPDLDMRTLVAQVRRVLVGKDGVGLRIPYWLGIVLGYASDAISQLLRKSLPVSSIRVKKFCATTAFSSSKHKMDDFVAPYSLSEGIENTLRSEFLSPDPDREIFYTE